MSKSPHDLKEHGCLTSQRGFQMATLEPQRFPAERLGERIPWPVNMRVLVVDDDESIRRLVGKMLRVLGHEGVMAENGLQALNYLSSSPGLIEMLITDLQMPELDGYAVIQEARRIRPDLGLVLMSANPEGSAPEDAIFLYKPFTLETLAKCLDLAAMRQIFPHEHFTLWAGRAFKPRKSS